MGAMEVKKGKNYAIEIDRLNFSFGNKKVLNEIDLKVPEGSIYGFLGPNGAGKSTTMRLLLNSIPYEKDNIKVLGQVVGKRELQTVSQISSLIENPSLYGHMSAEDNLRYIAIYRKIKFSRIKEVLEIVGLTEDAKTKVKKFSLGMKQRLAIAICILNIPKLLVLDEPVNGLDPKGTIEVRQLLKKLNHEYGVTIFISSHLLSEIEKLCTNVAILNKGKICYNDTMSSLKKVYENNKELKLSLHPTQAAKSFLDKKGIEFDFVEDYYVLREIEKQKVPALIKEIIAANILVYEVRYESSLEDWFLNITNG